MHRLWQRSRGAWMREDYRIKHLPAVHTSPCKRPEKIGLCEVYEPIPDHEPLTAPASHRAPRHFTNNVHALVPLWSRPCDWKPPRWSSTRPLEGSDVTARRPDGTLRCTRPRQPWTALDETDQDLEGEGPSDRQQIVHKRSDALGVQLFESGGCPKGGYQDQRGTCTVPECAKDSGHVRFFNG